MALLLVVPLQGLAATLAPLLCLANEHHSIAAVNAYEHHDDVTLEHGNHAADQRDSSPAGDHVANLCCNMFTSVPTASFVTASSTPPVYESYTLIVPPPFVPERQQRPPRA